MSATRPLPAPAKPTFVAPPEGPLDVPAGVDVWRARLDPPPERIAALERILSDEERGRAGRFVADVLRRRFVVRRGLVREVLARYLRVDPAAIEFAHGRHGRPRVASPETPALDYSASDSHELALFAVTGNGPIGVDVELIRDVPDAERIAERWFPATEREAVAAARGAERQDAFFCAWACLEAQWKAHGVGLRAIWSGEEGESTAVVSCGAFVPAEGYVGSLAAPPDVLPRRWFEAL